MVLNNNYCNQSIIEIYYLTKEDLVNLGLWRMGMNLYFIVSNLLLACVEMFCFYFSAKFSSIWWTKKKLHKKLKKQGNNLNN